ncbi:hypothetical protein [Methylobacterium nigriterrae]|uniref:hypothetical protein n=1 Tax=Methylobacterium nigriterrae TaxID=3127512 RepID=UPI003013A401
MRTRLAVVLVLAAFGARARTDVDTGGRQGQWRTCLADLDDIKPPGSAIADRERFCDCYADAAVKARLPELERVEANQGEETAPPQARATRAIRDARSDEIARACLDRR